MENIVVDDAIQKNIVANDVIHEECQYLHLVQTILAKGHIEEGRNGITKCIFGNTMRFSLQNGKIPILTTKKTAWKTCIKELLWFIRGQTDNTLLQEQGVHIWDANASTDFLHSRGLSHYEENELGPIYGRQWRNFNAPYVTNKEKKEALKKYADNKDNSNAYFTTEYKGIDQLQQIIDALKDPVRKNSRRLVMTAWNPLQLDEMALPPCHISCQFNVVDGNKLSCAMFQRSCDVSLGCPFNIASYSFLTHLIAKHCNLVAHEFVYFMGNCHIYEDHLQIMKDQIHRIPFDFPTVEIINKRENINDYAVDDFVVNNYHSHEAIAMNVVA
jgi:thymidylate synthase